MLVVISDLISKYAFIIALNMLMDFNMTLLLPISEYYFTYKNMIINVNSYSPHFLIV